MRTTASVIGVLVGLVVASAGCSSGEAEPSALPPVPSAEASAEPDLSAPPTPSATATVTAGAGVSPSDRPADSSDALPSEASAFTKHFFNVVNEAYLQRRVDPVQRLSSPECGSCAAVIADISRLSKQDHRVAGRRYVLSSSAAAPVLADGRTIVDFRFTADPYVERDNGDSVVKQYPAQAARDGQMLLTRRNDSWRVVAIRLLDS